MDKEEKNNNFITIVIIIAYIILAFAKMYISVYKLESSDKYNLFIDLLSVLIGIMVALGVLIYDWIYKKIDKYVKEEIKECEKNVENKSKENIEAIKLLSTQGRRFTEAQSFKNAGYLHYHIFSSHAKCDNEKEKEDTTEQLRKAIFYTELALSATEGKEGVKGLEEEENETLICAIKNNLAYFLAAKWTYLKERNIKELNEYMKNRKNKYEADKLRALKNLDYVMDCVTNKKEHKKPFSRRLIEEMIDTNKQVRDQFKEIDTIINT